MKEKKLIDKDLLILELKRIRVNNMFNQYAYKAIQECINAVELMPSEDTSADH